MERFYLRRYLNILILALLGGGGLFPLDIDLEGGPEAVVPLGSSSDPYYALGGGLFLAGEVEVFDSFVIGSELGLFMTPLKGTDTTPNFATLGLRGGFFHYPYSRLRMEYSFSAGPYSFSYLDRNYSDLWWKLSAEGGYRFSPEFTLAGHLGYIYLNSTTEPMYTGITAGIFARYKFDTNRKSGGELEVRFEQPEPIYPIFSTLYRENPIGTVTIQNNESADISDIRVSFRAGNYTKSTMFCGSAEQLKKHGAVQVPLYADLSGTIQNFTEEGRIPGELIIRYKLLGADRIHEESLVLSVYNRNSIRWTDPALIVSFASPNSPEVLDYSKYIAGIARNELRTGLNREMQFAMYLLEGLNKGGIQYSHDTVSPYETYHRDSSLLDYIQYPYQTLAYQTGDYDDLGLLLASSLESVGIDSALICLENDFLVAFVLDITEDGAAALFDSTEKLLNMGGRYWIPLSMSVLREGFINSWYRGIQNLSDAINQGEETDVIITKDAWKTYPPSGISGSEAQFQKPTESIVKRAVEADLNRYITSEFGPKIRDAQAEIEETGGSRALYSRLGLLYVRAGLYGEAKEQFLKSAEMGSLSALVNLGNIAILERDYETAGQWFRQALDKDPDNLRAQRGWDRVQTELME